jgi:hypothetical protein
MRDTDIKQETERQKERETQRSESERKMCGESGER